MANDEREAEGKRHEPGKHDKVMQDEDQTKTASTKRVQDKTLVRNLRELYRPVLEEPVPDQFLEILRRRKDRNSND